MLTSGCFAHLDWANVFIAGGSVLHCLRSFTDAEFDSINNNQETVEYEAKSNATIYPESIIEWDGQTYKKVDFDLFIYGLDEASTKNKVYT